MPARSRPARSALRPGGISRSSGGAVGCRNVALRSRARPRCSRVKARCTVRVCWWRRSSRDREQRQGATSLLTLATKIEEDWLRELFPESLRDETSIEFNPALRRLTGHRKILFHDLVLRSEEFSPKADPAAAPILARKSWRNLSPETLGQRGRAMDCSRKFRRSGLSGIGISPIDEAGNCCSSEQICQGATSYKEIKERPVGPVVKSWLSATQQQTLEELAPERIKLAKGRAAKIIYGRSRPTDDRGPHPGFI